MNSVAVLQTETEYQGGRLLWLLPSEEDDQKVNIQLLEYAAQEAGEKGLFTLSLSIDEDSFYTELFLKSGYTNTGWEQAWLYSQKYSKIKNQSILWRKTTSSDLHELTVLQNSLFSPRELTLETPLRIKLPDFCLIEEGEMRGYVIQNSGIDQTILSLYISKEVQSPTDILNNLFTQAEPYALRSYLLLRSNQAWLTMHLRNNFAAASGKRIRMTKQLTARIVNANIGENRVSSNSRRDIVTPASK